jgi:hypothetical protein
MPHAPSRRRSSIQQARGDTLAPRLLALPSRCAVCRVRSASTTPTSRRNRRTDNVLPVYTLSNLRSSWLQTLRQRPVRRPPCFCDPRPAHRTQTRFSHRPTVPVLASGRLFTLRTPMLMRPVVSESNPKRQELLHIQSAVLCVPPGIAPPNAATDGFRFIR